MRSGIESRERRALLALRPDHWYHASDLMLLLGFRPHNLTIILESSAVCNDILNRLFELNYVVWSENIDGKRRFGLSPLGVTVRKTHAAAYELKRAA